MTSSDVKVYDFFSGCGGASIGFQQAGMQPVFALDFNSDAIKTYQHNFPQAHTVEQNIKEFSTQDFAPYFDTTSPSLFCACAPCQPFSKIKAPKASDERIHLLDELSRFVEEFRPDFIFIENVSGVQTRYKNGPLDGFLKIIASLGYVYTVGVVDAKHYGVPQNRVRLVVLASRHGKVELPAATHGPQLSPYRTVRDAIGQLPEISAGSAHPEDNLHKSAGLSEMTYKRLVATPPEKGRESWPEELTLACHKDHKGHYDVYGRMRWDSPANTLTTRCNSISNGRFGHPEQNRAISMREAALLQSFPPDFQAFGNSLESIAQQIGNAVPPSLAKCIGQQFQATYQQPSI